MSGRAPGSPLPRRSFLGTAAGLTGAAVAGLANLPGRADAKPPAGRRSAPQRTRQEAVPWARLEPVGPDAWAVVSTPLNDHPDARRTLCNGGIVAGREGVLVVEAFGSPAGARWVSDQALRLTGRRPTHVVLTHYHGDHVTGGAGYLLAEGVDEAPALLATRTTRRMVAEHEAALPEDRSEASPLLLPDVLLSDDVETTLDLGGRTVRLTGRRGHTPSDVVIDVDDTVYPGDLVWNGMFPNYMDAIPSALAAHVRALRDQRAERYVSGHGTVATVDDLDRYLDLLDHVEAAARRALEAGRPLEEAAADYVVPPSLGEWYMFSARYPEVAFRAWERELSG